MADEDRAARSAAWGVVAAVFASSAIALWLAVPDSPTIVLIAACLATVVGAAGLYMCFASLSGTWPAWRPLRRGTPPADPPLPARPPPPVNIILRAEQDGDRLRLTVVNKGDIGRFSAEVINIIATGDNLPLQPSSWPIPWLEDGSIDPKEIAFTGSRILDFARYEVKAVRDDLFPQHWEGHHHWWFSSLPESVGFIYHTVGTMTDSQPQHYLVTIRIIRTDPPNSTDRQLAVGINGLNFLCEPLDGEGTASEH